MVILYWCLIPTGTWEELVLEAAFASGVDAVEISAHAIEFQDLENALYRIYDTGFKAQMDWIWHDQRFRA